jgi:hypothetical protein
MTSNSYGFGKREEKKGPILSMNSAGNQHDT